MSKKYRLGAAIVGLFVAGSIVVQARNSNATGFQQDSTFWTQRISCPQVGGQDMCRGWGSVTRFFNPGTGLFETVKGVHAWRMTDAPGGWTITAALRSTGSIITSCVVEDRTIDQFPVNKIASVCNAGVRTRVTAVY